MLKQLYWGGAICIVVLLLASCENFLKAQDTAEQIKEAIEIANSNPITYYLIAEKDSGTVIPASVSKKKKETFEIKFTPADDWQFIKWEAIDRTTGELIPDAVAFADATKLETTATIIKPTENLQIHPKCVMMPKIVSITPASIELAYANTPIVITFNMPMEAETTTAENTFFKYGDQYISLKYETIDMTSYFEDPVFNSDKTILTINPRIEGFTEYIQKELKLPVVNIKMSFGSGIYIEKEGVSLSLNNSQSKEISINYRQEAETQPPVEINQSFFISKQEITPSNASQLKAQGFHQDNISNQGDMSFDLFKEKVFHNLTNGTFYISGTYYDEGSGVKTVSVKAIYEENGAEEIFDYSEGSDEALFITNNGYTTFYIKVSLTVNWQFTSRRIEVNVLDACGNASETKIYYAAIKGFVLEDVTLCHFDYDYGEDRDPNLFLDNNIFDMNYYEENIKTIKIFHDDDHHTDRGIWEKYEGVSNQELLYPTENYTIECEYIDKYGILRRKSFSDYNESELCWKFDLDVDSVNNLDVKIIASDGIGNTVETTRTFTPISPLIITNTENLNSNKVKIYFDTSFIDGGSSEAPDCLIWEEGNVFKYDMISQHGYITIEDGKDYWLFKNDYYYKRPMSEVLYNTQIEQTEVPTLSFSKDPEIKKRDDGYVNIQFTIPENSWTANEYGMIYVDIQKETSNEIIKKREAFPKNQTTLTITRTAGFMLGKNDIKVSLYGMKNGFLSSKTNYTIPRTTDLSYDTIVPDPHLVPGNSFEYCYEQNHADGESGIDYVQVYVNNSLKFTFSEIDENGKIAVKIPRIDVLENDGANYYKIVAVDKADNKWENKYTEYATPLCPFYFDSKTDSSWNFTTGEVNWNRYWVIYCTLFKFDVGSKTWIKNEEKNTAPSEYSYNLSFDVPQNSFIKVSSRSTFSFNNMNHYGIPRYYYTGTQNTGNYDLILSNGSEKDSVAISSDAPVFVQTMVTSKDYSTVKNWSTDKWEFRAKSIGEEQITFSSNDHSPKKYKIPVDDEIESGNCYVVIAHFADGTTTKSQVMQK